MCDTTVKCKSITVKRDDVGLNDEKLEVGIIIYPNPASEMITIDKENQNISSDVIYSSDGKKVGEIELTTASTQISIQNWIKYIKNVSKLGELKTWTIVLNSLKDEDDYEQSDY